MDENAISVQCKIEGCNARVHGDVKCKEHGGDPLYQWRHSDWGNTVYSVRKETHGGVTR